MCSVISVVANNYRNYGTCRERRPDIVIFVNVAGSRASNDSEIYEKTREVVTRLIREQT